MIELNSSTEEHKRSRKVIDWTIKTCSKYKMSYVLWHIFYLLKKKLPLIKEILYDFIYLLVD